MARMLYLRDSAAYFLNILRRHLRLCRQNPHGAPFILAIQPIADALQDKVNLQNQAVNNREDANDDVKLADYDLDNTIKNTFETWGIYTRKHSTDLKALVVFPSGTFSQITRMAYAEEPNEADNVASKIESLGNAHELYPLAAEIRTETANVRTKIDAHIETIRLEKAAEAEVEIAKINARRGYEANYLNARLQLGVTAAERLFPIFPHQNEEPESNPS